MKIILQKDIPSLGKKHDVKDVKSGHALNLLIPRGEAVAATPAAMKKAEAARAAAEGEKRVREDLSAKAVAELDGASITVSGKTSGKGHLFAGMHREAVAAELKNQLKIDIDPSFIMLEHPVKETGEHEIEARAGGKSAKFKLVVEAA